MTHSPSDCNDSPTGLLPQPTGAAAATADFAALLGDADRIATDRAIAELRAGRPVAIEDEEAGGFVVLALDCVTEAMFSAFAALHGATLVLSADRATAVGLPGGLPIAAPLVGVGFEQALALASEPERGPPESWHRPEHAQMLGIALCKHGLLLPASLAVPIAAFPSNAPLHRVAARQLDAGLAAETASIEIASEARVPLAGDVESRFVVFRGGAALRDQVAVVIGNPDPSRPVLVRLHSACLTGDLFGSLRCDCGDQLRSAISCLAAEGGGVLLYLDQEGRGTGIRNKMRAYRLQDAGFDTIDADAMLGFSSDERRYELAAAMLARLGYDKIRLLTNNPDKLESLRRAGIEIVGRRPLLGIITTENRAYLATKAHRAGHMLDELLRNHSKPAGGGSGE